ncbi:MAG: hypothetical protein WB297_10860, partial [Actinomycetota bacterium]
GYVGLRWGELAGLALDHVDLLRRTIRIVITGQARVPRVHPAVQVEDTAAARMAQLIRELGQDATPPQDVRLP